MPPTHTDEGLVAAETIRRRWSQVGVLVLSQYVEAEYALRLLHGGEERCGYLLKDRVLDAGQLADAVRRISEGGVVVDPELVARLVGRSRPSSPLDELTAREREVLALMAEGLTDKGIGERLFVTPKTVETHIRHIFAKLSLPDTPGDNKRVHAVLTLSPHVVVPRPPRCRRERSSVRRSRSRDGVRRLHEPHEAVIVRLDAGSGPPSRSRSR